MMPSPLDYIGRRRFSFYPPIRNLGDNEWILGPGSRSDVQVVNYRTGRGAWLSRQYIGAVSEIEDHLVVGLTKELEHRHGTLRPRVKAVIEMQPFSENLFSKIAERPPGPAEVIAIRLEDPAVPCKARTLAKIGIAAVIFSLLMALFSAVIHY